MMETRCLLLTALLGCAIPAFGAELPKKIEIGKHSDLTLTGDDLSISVSGGASTIAIRLTQQQTLGLAVGRAEIQVKFIGSDGTTQATDIKPITVDRALLERVVEYE